MDKKEDSVDISDEAKEENQTTVEEAEQEEPPSAEETLKAKVAELSDTLLREKAETENIRKRLHKQKLTEVKYASLPLIRELLIVVDNLELALKYADNDDPLKEGVAMALDGMKKVFSQHGLSQIKGEGEIFDPTLHEALSAGSNAEKLDNEILEVVKAGYLFHDRLVRAAGVVVNHPPADVDSDGKGEEGEE